MIIDSHVNLHAHQFDEDRDEVIARARAAGVRLMVEISDKVSTFEATHAVAMANDSQFGLSAWVTGQDKVAAFQTGLKIRSGAVNVNGAVMSSYASGGGIKMSGLGRERGKEGLREFQMVTTFNIGG